MRVVVLGDIGVDRYHIGTVRGQSAEADIPILSLTSTLDLPAMAGNVLANLVALGVDADYLPTPTQQYPIKNRLVTSGGEQLARWDEFDRLEPYAETAGELSAEISYLYDAILVCDYGKGSITDSVAESLVWIATKDSTPLFVDTKSSPTRFLSPSTLFFPNEKEFSSHLASYLEVPNLVVKMSEAGVYGEWRDKAVSFPSICSHPLCVNGAGDTVMAAFVSATLREFSFREALQFANTAAGLVCEQPFSNRTISFPQVTGQLQFHNAVV